LGNRKTAVFTVQILGKHLVVVVGNGDQFIRCCDYPRGAVEKETLAVRCL
jgi:hypothetical protein